MWRKLLDSLRLIADCYPDSRVLNKEIEPLLKKWTHRMVKDQRKHALRGTNEKIPKLELAQQEIAALRTDIKHLRAVRSKQFAEIQKLQHIKRVNFNLMRELENANQIIKQLHFRIEHAGEMQPEDPVRLDILEVLQNKLNKMHKEKMYLEMRDIESSQIIAELKCMVSALKESVINSKINCDKQVGSQQEALKEVRRLKKELKNKSANVPSVNFKEFVSMKREITALKVENEKLKIKLVKSIE